MNPEDISTILTNLKNKIVFPGSIQIMLFNLIFLFIIIPSIIISILSISIITIEATFWFLLKITGISNTLIIINPIKEITLLALLWIFRLIFIILTISMFGLPIYYFFYLFSKRYKTEKESLEKKRQADKQEEILNNEKLIKEKIQNIFINENIKNLIKNFAKNYCVTELTEITAKNIPNELNISINKENFEKLQELLSNKYKLNIDNTELKEIITFIKVTTLLEKFEETILKKETLEQIIEIYTLKFGEKSLNYEKLILLKKYLKKKKIPYENDANLITKIETTKKINELNIFENKINIENKKLIDDIDHMKGSEFENYLGKLFELEGYTIEKITHSNDQGGDLIIKRFDKKIVIQAKRWNGKVPNKAIQEVVAAKAHYSCDEAWIVTNSNLTRQAHELAKTNKVRIIERKDLIKLID